MEEQGIKKTKWRIAILEVSNSQTISNPGCGWHSFKGDAWQDNRKASFDYLTNDPLNESEQNVAERNIWYVSNKSFQRKGWNPKINKACVWMLRDRKKITSRRVIKSWLICKFKLFGKRRCIILYKTPNKCCLFHVLSTCNMLVEVLVVLVLRGCGWWVGALREESWIITKDTENYTFKSSHDAC